MIALFARDDRHYPRIRSLVRELSAHGLLMLTTWPCVVEASYLLQPPYRFELLQWVEREAARQNEATVSLTGRRD